MKPEDVIAIYDEVGAEFAAARTGLSERNWLDRFFMLVPRYDAAGNVARRVLDVGAGSGRPIAAYLSERGVRVTGLDASETMLQIFRANLPQLRAIKADMRRLEPNDAFTESFDGLIAWDSFFHLSAADQRSTLPRLARALVPHGVMLLTTGHFAGIAVGEVGGRPIFHESLSPEDYAALFDAAGLDVISFVPEDPQTTHHSVWLLRKRPT